MRVPGQAPLSTKALLGVSETLLIPLVARADAHRRFPQLRFRDIYSELILQALDVNAARFRSDGGSMLGSCLRACWMERTATSFLHEHPGALGVSLGAGLDTLYMRLCDGPGDLCSRWYDVDLPPVIDLKRELLTETQRYHLLAADLLDPQLLDRLSWQSGQPAVFVMEGVLMYLRPAAVAELLRRLFATASWRRSTVAVLFDFCSPFMARHSHRHPSVRRTGAAAPGQQPFQWSLEHPQELQWLQPNLQVRSVYDLMRDCGTGPRLVSWLHRRLTGRLFYGCAHVQIDPPT